MSESNRVRIAGIRESVFGTLPGTPRFRTGRMTGESLAYAPQFISSSEIRADRMNADPIKINEEHQGAFNFELAYVPDLSLASELMRSAFYNPWTVTPYRDNDGAADSVVTDVNNATQVVTVTAVAPADGQFRVGHLVRFTGFTNAANNGLFRCSTASTTVPAFTGAGLVAEAVPPAAARMKVVGAQGASADITATATGLGSTALDFTTLGLSVGQWIKIGDASNAAFQFATAALNDWARITAIGATALTLDNLPSGWTTDSGTGKTIRFFFGDTIKNGTTRSSLSIERGFLDQASPTYILQKGMVAGQMALNFTTEQIITGSFNLRGLSGTQGTSANGASYDAAPTQRVMSANVNVGRIAEAGSVIASPNFIRAMQVQLDNNLRPITAVGTVGAVELGAGECAVTGSLEAYFGSNALLAKLLAGTVSNLNARAAIDNQAIIVGLPRVTFTGGSPSAAGKNQDITIPLSFQASIDTVTNAVMLCDRLEYYN